LSAGISSFPDEGSWEPQDTYIRSRDPLGFPGYSEGLKTAALKAGSDESLRSGPARFGDVRAEYAEFEFAFFGGSMGEAAGERLALAMERAAEAGVPFVLRTRTGGARMQEGMRSLVQMPKVVSARLTLAASGSPFIAVLDNPSTGGVLASLAALADITLAISGATIGFAGPRIVERFTGHPVGSSSHTAESALASGLVDDVVEPEEIRDYLCGVLGTFEPDLPVPILRAPQPLEEAIEDAWAAVEAARAPDRTRAHELLMEVCESYVALRGDRSGEDDPALDVAVARLNGRRLVAMALDRERSPGPGAYRKARRAVKIAERLQLPIVTLVDTRGADPSPSSESSGIAWEIAELFQAMLEVNVPTISVVTGEGGSGGALAFACTDILLAYEGSIFSVIGPELAAEILWRDVERAPDAARVLKLTAKDLRELQIADGLLPDPPEPDSLRQAISYHLGRLESGHRDIVGSRLERWRDRYGD
jgi:acetyl-CoA carboxylase carboxyl transferase subunit beta